VRLASSNDAVVKGLSTAGHTSGQEDELVVAEVGDFQAVPLHDLTVRRHVGGAVVEDACGPVVAPAQTTVASATDQTASVTLIMTWLMN
jgi:hypothetical protein